jgi:hypothetical protein
MSKLGGHNSGHSAETRELPERAEGGEVAEGEETFWRALRDDFRTVFSLHPEEKTSSGLRK